MKLLPAIAALLLIAGASPPSSAADTPEAAAQAAALAWLALVDAGSYAQSWQSAAAVFKNALTESQWASRIAAVRGPLGSVRSRSVSSAKLAHSLPGAPDGDYVVIQYATSFEHKATATETVTPMKDPDGHWRVSGYYIR